MKRFSFIILFILFFSKSYSQYDQYIYDNYNRLTQIDNGDCSGIKYTYDANGNRKSIYQYDIITKDSVTNETCPHSNDGSITLTSSSYFSYKWNNGLTSPTINNLSPGNYSVLIIDTASKATCSKTFTVKSQFVDSFILKTHDDFCTANSVTSSKVSVVVPDVRAKYVYHWSTSNDTAFTTTDSISNIAPGKYTVAIRNTYTGCIKTFNFLIAGSVIVSPVVHNESCPHSNNGSIALMPSDSSLYSYRWNTGQTTSHLASLSPGNYSVTIKSTIDSTASCKQSYTIQPQFVDSFAVQSQNITCFEYGNGLAHVNIIIPDTRASYSYHWSNINDTSFTPKDSITNLSPGSYSVRVRNSFTGCYNSLPFTITQPTAIINGIDKTDNTCYGIDKGNALVKVQKDASNYSYAWTGTNLTQTFTTQKIDSLPNGTYVVTVTENFGNKCMLKDSVSISGPTADNLVGISTDYNATCFGAGVTLQANVLGNPNGYRYEWFNKTTNTPVDQTGSAITNIQPGNYLLTIIAFTSDSCKSVKAFTVNQLTPDSILYPNPTTGMVNIAVCTQSSANISYTVSSAIGQKLETEMINSIGRQVIQIDLSKYPTGVYFITLMSDTQKMKLKVVKL